MPKNITKPTREAWEDELFAMYRWGRIAFWFKTTDDTAQKEHARLKQLWNQAQPVSKPIKRLIDQIRSLEICNWNLEESIMELCRAIGRKSPTPVTIGHMGSVSEERWGKIWVYYLTLRSWLAPKSGGYQMLLKSYAPKKAIQKHIVGMLGNRTALKEAYVELFCLVLERWLGDFSPGESTRMKAHNAAVAEIEKRIIRLDPQRKIIPEAVLKSDGDGRLQPCNHKAFRRYDMIISSIGGGKWRAVMPRRGIDGLARAALIERFLLPIELWIQRKSIAGKNQGNKLSRRIHLLLGKPDRTKLFLASLLLSLLRSQQIAARKLAQSRMQK